MAYHNKNSRKSMRVNNQIDEDQVRLVDAKGEMVGVVSINEALMEAKKSGLDLVEIAPEAKPPVCKLLDYGKYRFEQQRKRKDNKQKQKTVHLKEIKIRPTIDKHDYEVKLRAMQKFLGAGDKVKISLRFRGREITHMDLGRDLMQRIKEDLGELAKVELDMKMEGRQMMMVLAPAG